LELLPTLSGNYFNLPLIFLAFVIFYTSIELKENIIEGEQQSDVENVEVQEHCNQQNGEDKELIIDEPSVDKQSVEKPLKTEDETQVEEVEQ